MDALLLIWPRHSFVLVWLWPQFSYRDDWTLLLKWPRPRIDMRGRKEDFWPSVISQFEYHFSCHWYRKFEGHLLQMKVIFIDRMTVHFGHRKYSQWDRKSAPKNSQSFIISIGQTICKENNIEVNLEQIIPPEKDSRRTYYRLEQCFPWIWTVLNTIFNDFNNKSIKGDPVFQKRSNAWISSFHTSACTLNGISHLALSGISHIALIFALYGISHITLSGISI